MFALVDCNNFYVSCERFLQPGLNTMPVIVLSNNDGCAISRSDEAKALGIKMGDAPHVIKGQLKKNNVSIFSSNYELYGDLSDRVMKTLGGFVPRMEIYSIDEAFLDMTGMPIVNHEDFAQNIRHTISHNFRIPICIGIAPTKTLAKMANRYAKKMHQATGIYYAKDADSIGQMLATTAAADIWGVGQQYAAMLQRNNITTALDFVNAPEDFIRSTMHIVGLRTQKELKGIACLEWKMAPDTKKIIGCSRSFGILVTSKNIIREALSEYASVAAARLRNQQSVAGHLKVFIHTNPYRLQDEQYYQSVIIEMERATSNTNEIIEHAFKGLDLIYRPGFNYLKCGIELGKIVPANEVQLSLFTQPVNNNSSKAVKALDNINNRFGKDLVKFAVQGHKKIYKSRANHLSKCCTTRLEDMLTIKN